MNDIVRRLRDYENETGPVSLRGLRDDAASEIVALRVALVLSTITLMILALQPQSVVWSWLR